LPNNGKVKIAKQSKGKAFTLLTFPKHAGIYKGLIFETLMGVFRIRLQCGKSGCAPRMMLGLANNALNHYMANPM
jgi:hypothetical protein